MIHVHLPADTHLFQAAYFFMFYTIFDTYHTGIYLELIS